MLCDERISDQASIKPASVNGSFLDASGFFGGDNDRFPRNDEGATASPFDLVTPVVPNIDFGDITKRQTPEESQSASPNDGLQNEENDDSSTYQAVTDPADYPTATTLASFEQKPRLQNPSADPSLEGPPVYDDFME